MEKFACDVCHNDKIDELYIGWFETDQASNPWATGTASANLMRRLQVCYDCAKKMGKDPNEALEYE